MQWKDKQLQIDVLVKIMMLRKKTTRGGIVIVQYILDFFSVPIEYKGNSDINQVKSIKSNEFKLWGKVCSGAGA